MDLGVIAEPLAITKVAETPDANTCSQIDAVYTKLCYLFKNYDSDEYREEIVSLTQHFVSLLPLSPRNLSRYNIFARLVRALHVHGFWGIVKIFIKRLLKTGGC